MILTRENIIEEIKFVPALDVFQVNPHSVDLRLSESVLIAPNETRILKSMENISLSNDVMGVVYPRSSTNRRGLQVHMTGIVDANYSGTLMIPITNCTNRPIALMMGERVASIVFQRLERQAVMRLSKYHGTNGDYIPDKGVEAALIASGDLIALKRDHSL